MPLRAEGIAARVFSPLLRLAWRSCRVSAPVACGLSLFTFALLALASSPVVAQPPVARRVTQQIDEARVTVLKGHVSPLVKQAEDRGAVDDSASLGPITVLLSRTDEQQKNLDALVDQMHNAHSKSYHKWLTPAQFGQLFEPADEDVAAVRDWLVSKGLSVVEIPPSKTHITVNATAGQLREAFHVEIHNLMLNGEAHMAAINEPQVPAALAPVISGLHRLDDFRPKPQHVVGGAAVRDPKTGRSMHVQSTPTLPSIADHARSGKKQGPDYYNGTLGHLDIGPQDFYTIYNENSTLNAGITGAGQTVAVLEEVTVNPADVNSFRAQFDLPAYPATPNSTQGGVNYIYGTGSGVGGDAACGAPAPYASDMDEELEGDLDLQWTGVTAPNATIDYVSCGNIEAASQHVVNYMAGTVTSASLSYGGCEGTNPATATHYWINLWEQYAAEGITAIVSSGDSGTTACNNNDLYVTRNPSVNYIAATPWDIAAGGTDLGDYYVSDGFNNIPITTWWEPNTANNGDVLSYVPEIAWGDACSSGLTASLEYYQNGNTGPEPSPEYYCNAWGPYTEGSSGGISIVNAAPSWQNVYGVGLYSGSTTQRTLPDIALFAAGGWWAHSLLICESDRTACTTSPDTDTEVGGTSAVAPMVNGIMALINQKTGSSQGQADYTLYNLAAQEYGLPSSPNTANLASCSGSYQGANIGSNCIFQDIAATPSLQGGNIFSDNVQPCTAAIADCYFDNTSDAYGLTTPTGGGDNPPLGFYVGAGYDMITGLGSVNINNLVQNWSNVSPGFATTTALSSNAASLSYMGSVNLSVSVTATGRGGNVAPAGVVQFYLGSTSGTLLGQGTLTPACTGGGGSTSCAGIAALTVTQSQLVAGANTIVAYFEGDAANDAASTSNNLVVTNVVRAQAIRFQLPPSTRWGIAPTNLASFAADNAGLPITFKILSGPATLNGSVATATGLGPVMIQASQAGNSSYGAASPVTQTITIEPAILTVHPGNAFMFYGGMVPTVSNYSITGFVNGDSSSVVSGVPQISIAATSTSPVGNYPVSSSLGGLAAANYAFVFNNGVLTIAKARLNVTATNLTMTQGAAVPALAYTITGFSNGDTQFSATAGAPTLSTTATSSSKPGKYPITVSVGSLTAGNYAFAAVNGVLTVLP